MSSSNHSNPPENIGYFATRPLQLRLLTGFVLALALVAWLTGWIMALTLGYDHGWDFEPFRWASRFMNSPETAILLFVISSYAALTSVAGFCVIAGMRPALKPNLWVLVSLAMASAAVLPFALGFAFGFAFGETFLVPTALACYMTMLPLLPTAVWVVNHRYNFRSKQLLKTSSLVFATVGTMLAGAMVIEAARNGFNAVQLSDLVIILLPLYASLGLFGLTLFLSRNLYKTQLWQLAGTACLNCGYDLQGLSEQTQNCPECGCAIGSQKRLNLS